MPSDPSIILGSQPVQIQDPLTLATKAMTLKSLALENQGRQRALDDQMAMRQAYKDNMQVGADGTPSVNLSGFISQLSDRNPQLAIEQGMQIQKNQQEMSKARLDKLNADHAVGSQLMNELPQPGDPDYNDSNNQAAWTRMLAKRQVAGLSNNQFTEQYPGPGMVKAIQNRQMEHGEMLKQQNAEAGIANEKAKLEIERFKTFGGNPPPGISGSNSSPSAPAAPAPKAKVAANGKNSGAGNEYGDLSNTDPATLVNQKVPPADRAKVFEEIKDAQNMRKLAPKILAAFDMANTRDPVTHAQGAREFEGILNTTIADTEGTARQAAFKSIHDNMGPGGFAALPGENSTKRRTIAEYMSSKSAAPTAAGYGIDLTKYKNSNLNFDPVNMKDPNTGKVHSVPFDLVDKAKKAGGIVVP